MPFGEQRRDGGAQQPVALVLEPVDLDEVRREVGAVAQPAQRGGDLLGAADEHLGELLAPAPSAPRRRRGRAGRRPPRRSRRCRRARPRARGRRPRRARARRWPFPASRWRMSWAIRSPSCSQSRISRASAGRSGIVGEQVAQQQRGALHVARGLLEQAEQLGVGLRLGRPHAADARPPARRAPRGVHSLSQRVHRPVTGPRRGAASLRRDGADARSRGAPGRRSGGPAGRAPRARERAGARRSRCASSSCSRRWPGGRAASSPREELYATVWGAPLRAHDRSVDVYVHKLRSKLARALPEWRLHPHALRVRLPLRAGAFTPFHNDGTAGNRLRRGVRACRTAHQEG